MEHARINHAGDGCVRVVFNDSSLSLSLAADVTFGELAQMLGDFPNQRYGDPLGIAVTFNSAQAGP